MKSLYFKTSILSCLCLISLLFYTSCSREIEDIQPIDYSYLPLKVGKYIIYDVDSIIYNEFLWTKKDTNSYQLKELVADSSIDQTGKLYYRLERFYRKDTTESWTLQNVWTIEVNDFKTERVEENKRFINMTFPIVENKTWDGLLYVHHDTLIPVDGGVMDIYKDWDDFKYTQMDQLVTWPKIGEKATLTVEQADKENKIERRYSIEKYAKGIGLVYKEAWILDTQCRQTANDYGNLIDCEGLSWLDKAEKGYILIQEIVDTNW